MKAKEAPGTGLNHKALTADGPQRFPSLSSLTPHVILGSPSNVLIGVWRARHIEGRGWNSRRPGSRAQKQWCHQIPNKPHPRSDWTLSPQTHIMAANYSLARQEQTGQGRGRWHEHGRSSAGVFLLSEWEMSYQNGMGQRLRIDYIPEPTPGLLDIWSRFISQQLYEMSIHPHFTKEERGGE